MIREDKELLLKDLCGRLPYGVIGRCEIDASYDTSFDTISQTHKFDAVVYGLKADLLFVTPLIEDKDEQEFANEEVADGVNILDFKPYLFPLSSITKEQMEELEELCDMYTPDDDYHPYAYLGIEVLYKHVLDDGYKFSSAFKTNVIDWFNKNHLDWRGLIPMGLANDATELNIY